MKRRSSYNPLVWSMSREQHGLFFELWERVCRVQGFNKLPTVEREAKRRSILAEVFLGPKSAKDINRTNEFDAIKAKFLELCDNLQGAMESGNPEIGERRRLLNRVDYYMRCVRVYKPQETVENILKSFRVFHGISCVEELSMEPRIVTNPKTGQLEEKKSLMETLLITLSRYSNDLRRAAGDETWEMQRKAKALLNARESEVLPEADSEEIPVNSDGVLVPF